MGYMICPRCKKELNDKSEVCVKCGHFFTPETKSQALEAREKYEKKALAGCMIPIVIVVVVIAVAVGRALLNIG